MFGYFFEDEDETRSRTSRQERSRTSYDEQLDDIYIPQGSVRSTLRERVSYDSETSAFRGVIGRRDDGASDKRKKKSARGVRLDPESFETPEADTLDRPKEKKKKPKTPRVRRSAEEEAEEEFQILLGSLEEEMLHAAEELDYEAAGRLKSEILALQEEHDRKERKLRKQRASLDGDVDKPVKEKKEKKAKTPRTRRAEEGDDVPRLSSSSVEAAEVLEKLPKKGRSPRKSYDTELAVEVAPKPRKAKSPRKQRESVDRRPRGSLSAPVPVMVVCDRAVLELAVAALMITGDTEAAGELETAVEKCRSLDHMTATEEPAADTGAVQDAFEELARCAELLEQNERILAEKEVKARQEAELVEAERELMALKEQEQAAQVQLAQEQAHYVKRRWQELQTQWIAKQQDPAAVEQPEEAIVTSKGKLMARRMTVTQAPPPEALKTQLGSDEEHQEDDSWDADWTVSRRRVSVSTGKLDVDFNRATGHIIDGELAQVEEGDEQDPGQTVLEPVDPANRWDAPESQAHDADSTNADTQAGSEVQSADGVAEVPNGEPEEPEAEETVSAGEFPARGEEKDRV